jgi:multicomponent Na+:H+ antiporter subunit E
MMIMKQITLFIILFLIWMAFSFNLETANIISGVFAALLTTLIFSNRFLTSWQKFYNPLRYFWLIIYIVIFVWECIKANFDVAYRVLSPKMPIKPGIVKVHSSLKTDIARVILANSITMTPGTITVDIIDSDLYIHWIYVMILSITPKRSSEDLKHY